MRLKTKVRCLHYQNSADGPSVMFTNITHCRDAFYLGRYVQGLSVH